MDDIYFCAISETALPAALMALSMLDEQVAMMYSHLYTFVPYHVDQIRNADPWCVDEFLRAAVHPHCSKIDKNIYHVHYLNPCISQTVHFSNDQKENAFVKRMGIQHEEKTVFCAQSGLNAIVLPFHSNVKKHWSLLVFYREEPDTAQWCAVHYDTLDSLNIKSAEIFVYKFCTELIKIEPQFRLINESCQPEVCHVTPWQGDGWSCGYRVIMIALLISHCKGSREGVEKSLVEGRFVTNKACATYLARAIEKCAKYQTLLAVRQRLRNLFDFSEIEKIQYNIENNKL